MMKKALPLTLVLIGTALLITAIVFWIDSSTSTEPESFGKSLRDWITLILGIGASIKGWMDLFKKEKPTPPTTKIDVKGNNSQISLGDNSPNIQTDTYIGTQIVQQPQEPKTPKSLNQLPAPPLDFVGREKELTELRQNIEKGVLISGVQGMGGIGKTALGLKLAEQIIPKYLGGQIFLDLRGAHEQTPLMPEQVMAHVIRSFHTEAALPIDFGELGALYRSTLSGKNVLLFYDNARDENQLQTLLPPKSCVLFVTSRQYFTLPGLAAIDLETLTSIEAVELVQEIAPKVSNKDAETLSKQCGYLPLAIRAAVSVLLLRPDWSPAELIKRLDNNQTRLGLVESTLSLSYDALDTDLQKSLRQLGVFFAPFDKGAAHAIWDNDSMETTDHALGELLRTSLLTYEKNADEYFFHDLVHLFLEEKCRQDVQADEILWRNAEYYIKLASQAEAEYWKGGDFVTQASLLFVRTWNHLNKASERLAFSGALEWKKPSGSKGWLANATHQIGGVLSVPLSPSEYLPFVLRGLAASRNLNNQSSEAWHLNYLGAIQNWLGNSQKSIESLEKALAIYRNIGERNSESLPLNNLGLAYSALGDIQQAIELYKQARDIASSAGDKRTEAYSLGNLGKAYIELGDLQQAVVNLEQVAVTLNEIGDRNAEATVFDNLGATSLGFGDARSAIKYCEQGLVIARAIGNQRVEGECLLNLGSAYKTLAENGKAIEHFEQALKVARAVGDKNIESLALGNLGFIKKSIDVDLGLNISEDTGARRNRALLLGVTAGNKRLEGKFSESLGLFEQALKIIDEIGDIYTKSQILDNMANTFADLGKYEDAIKNYLTAMELAKDVGDEELVANIAWNLATVYDEQKQYELAAKYMQITVDFENKINHPNASADLETLNEMRINAQNMNKPEKEI